MISDNSSADLRNLWQAEPQQPFQLSSQQLHARRMRLNRELRIRNATVWVVCLVEIAAFTWLLIALSQPILKFASTLVILAMAFLTGQVAVDQHRRRAVRLNAQTSGSLNSIDFFRAELEQQRQFHRGIWFWSRMAILLPSLLIWGIGAVVLIPWPEKIVGWCLIGVTVFVTPLAIQLNHMKSKTYQRQIDSLNALRQSQKSK